MFKSVKLSTIYSKLSEESPLQLVLKDHPANKVPGSTTKRFLVYFTAPDGTEFRNLNAGLMMINGAGWAKEEEKDTSREFSFTIQEKDKERIQGSLPIEFDMNDPDDVSRRNMMVDMCYKNAKMFIDFMVHHVSPALDRGIEKKVSARTRKEKPLREFWRDYYISKAPDGTETETHMNPNVRIKWAVIRQGSKDDSRDVGEFADHVGIYSRKNKYYPSVFDLNALLESHKTVPYRVNRHALTSSDVTVHIRPGSLGIVEIQLTVTVSNFGIGKRVDGSKLFLIPGTDSGAEKAAGEMAKDALGDEFMGMFRGVSLKTKAMSPEDEDVVLPEKKIPLEEALVLPVEESEAAVYSSEDEV